MLLAIIRYSPLWILLFDFYSSQSYTGESTSTVHVCLRCTLILDHFRSIGLRGGSQTRSSKKRQLDSPKHGGAQNKGDSDSSSEENDDAKKKNEKYRHDDSTGVIEGSELPSDLHESGL